MALAFLRKGKQPTIKIWVIFSPTIKVHDSQHEKVVQEGLLSSADNQERDEESGGANAMDE
jgi:hypothetical protein